MVRVLIITSHPKLVDAVVGELPKDMTKAEVCADWTTAQRVLFQDRFDLCLIDYEVFRDEEFDTFVTLDSVFQKENTLGVLIVRSAEAESTQIFEKLFGIERLIDLSQGREPFAEALRECFRSAVDELRSRRDDQESSVETDQVLAMEIDLPSLHEGSLAHESLARLLYTIWVRKDSGVLRVSAGANQERRYGFDQGALVAAPGFQAPSSLPEVFGWPAGGYVFEEGKSPRGPRTTQMLRMIWEGVRTQARQRKVLDSVVSQVHLIPVPTHLWHEREAEFSGNELLLQLIRTCDGHLTLEKAISKAGANVDDAFRAAYFCLQTDLLSLQDRKGLVTVSIRYSRDVRQARERVDEAAVRQTKAFRASGFGSNQLVRELTAQVDDWKRATPHEIFEIWEGCGRTVVQDRFYILVKEHHPDIYGGNIQSEVKALAQELFIMVKDAYRKLLTIEKEQTVAPPKSYRDQEDDPDSIPIPALGDERSEPSSFTARPPTTGVGARPIYSTPAAQRTTKPTPTPQRPASPTSEHNSGSDKPASTDGPKVDVRSKIEQLSGFKRRRRPHLTPANLTLNESSASEVIEPSEPSDPSEATLAERERKEKINHLLKKAQNVEGAPDPAMEFFNKGYRAFRNEDIEEAHEHFVKAWELDSDNGLYLTFYGYTLFRLEPEKTLEAEEILRRALNTGHRQAMPDACLFMGYILKNKGDIERAVRNFERALRLNPKCVEADREIRLHKMREKRKKSDPGTILKNLFKK